MVTACHSVRSLRSPLALSFQVSDVAIRRLQTRPPFWNERYTTEVTLRPYRGELTLLDSRGAGGGGGGGGGMDESGGFDDRGGEPAPAASRGAARPRKGDMDDDIPF